MYLCLPLGQLNLTISDTKGVIHNANPCPGYSFYIDFPECVNGTLILLQKLTLGPGGGLIINNVLYNDTFDTDPPTVLYVPPNTSVEVRGGNAERGEFKFFYNCTGKHIGTFPLSLCAESISVPDQTGSG